MSEPQPVGSDEPDDAQTPDTAADHTALTTDDETQVDDMPAQPGNS